MKKAMSLDANNALAYAYYAEILTAQGDYTLYDKAAEASKKALDLGPNLMEAHRARGIVFLNTQNLEEALQEFQTAMTINKNIPDLNLYLGITYKALGEYDQAQEALLAAYALDPTDTIALTELSRAFFGDGRFPQAAQYAEEAVKVEPSDPRLHGNLGIIYYKQEAYDSAIGSLGLAVRGGLFHLAGSGHARRLEWAESILRRDPRREEQVARQVLPALTAEFPTPARRPLFSAMNCDHFTSVFHLRLPPWEEALALAMDADL